MALQLNKGDHSSKSRGADSLARLSVTVSWMIRNVFLVIRSLHYCHFDVFVWESQPTREDDIPFTSSLGYLATALAQTCCMLSVDTVQ